MMQLNNQNTVKSDDHHALREALEEKAEEIQYMENLNKTLTLKERISNDELQDARKEAISVYFYLLLSFIYLYFMFAMLRIANGVPFFKARVKILFCMLSQLGRKWKRFGDILEMLPEEFGNQ